MKEIVINPEYEKLIKEVKQLKEEISNLYEEKEQLKYHTCKNIETEYMTKIGIYEYKAYEVQCKILRIRRKIQLYQLKINRQEKPNEEEIEKQLEIKYKKYQEKLEKMVENIQKAMDFKNFSINLSEEKIKEIKKIYRKLIKKFHPDLNQKNIDKNINIIIQATRAYENGDLETLKNLELLTEEIKTKEVEVNEMHELKEMKIKCEKILQEILKEIKKIKESFPYNKIEFLKSEILIQKKINELKNYVKQCDEIYMQLEDILEQLKEK